MPDALLLLNTNVLGKLIVTDILSPITQSVLIHLRGIFFWD